jgi:hypothetical protein
VLPISVDSDLRLENVHGIVLKIERKVKNLVANARLVIYAEPTQDDLENTWSLIKNIAEGVQGTRGISNINLQKIDRNPVVDVQVEAFRWR